MAFAIVPAQAAMRPAGPFKGRPLLEALEILQQRGLPLVFSTATISPDLVVTEEPRSKDPRALLDELLAPHGLEARAGPGGLLVVVAAPAAPPAPLRGHVEQIVVTPGQQTLVPSDQSERVTLEKEEILSAPAIGGDVSRVLELLPGIAAADNSASFHARGGDDRDVSMVLDGLELYEPFHLLSFQSPFSLVDTANVDRIEYLPGSFTAEYGDRHGGFVELSTAPPPDHDTLIEMGTLNSRFAWAGTAGSTGIMASGRAWYPEMAVETLETGEDGLDPRFGDAYLKVSWSTLPRTILSVHALLGYDVVRFREPGGGESVDSDERSGHVWFRALRQWTPELLSETVLSAGWLDLLRDGVSEPEDASFSVQDDRSVDFYGVAHQMSWRFTGSQLLRGGFQIRPIRGDYVYRSDEPGAGTRATLDPSGTSYGFFLAHRAALSSHVATEVGLRWDGQTFTQDEQFSPRLNVTWRPADGTEVRLGVGKYTQSQRIHELNIQDGETSFHTAELAFQTALTIQQRLTDGLRLRVDGWYRSLSSVQPRYENLFNPVELFPETEPDRVRVAPSAARMRGAEVMLQGKSGTRFHWWAGYTWSAAEDVIGGDAVPRSWDQTHAAKFLVGWRPTQAWSLALTGSAHTGWPTTPVTATSAPLPGGGVDVIPIVGERNSERLPDYLRFDLRVARAFELPAARVQLTLDVLNLTNRDNACCVDDFLFEPQPDGSVRVEPTLDDWLGITPSFSVRVEF